MKAMISYGATMNLGKIIDHNLLIEALDDAGREKTLLPEEKCKYCGREITSIQGRQRGDTICGVCRSEDRRLKKLRCRVTYGKRCQLAKHDPILNGRQGDGFRRAFDRAYGLEPVKLSRVAMEWWDGSLLLV